MCLRQRKNEHNIIRGKNMPQMVHNLFVLMHFTSSSPSGRRNMEEVVKPPIRCKKKPWNNIVVGSFFAVDGAK